MRRKIIYIVYRIFAELFVYYHLHIIWQMLYNIIFYFHKSYILYSHGRIKVYKFFLKNTLILLKLLDGCSMIQLRQIVLAQMAEYCGAMQTVSLYLGRCCLHSLWRLPLKKFHDDVPYGKSQGGQMIT